jgi:hypothetical protein
MARTGVPDECKTESAVTELPAAAVLELCTATTTPQGKNVF